MRTTTSLTATTIAALALVVGLAGCGSSSGSDGAKDKDAATTVAKGSEGDATTTTEADGGDDTSTTVVATGGGEFCDELADYINDSSMADVDMSDPDSYKDAIEASTEKGKELLSKAPDELDDEVEVILDAQDKLVDELKKVDYDFTKLPADALSAMDTLEVQAAGEKLDAYVTDTCGIDLPQTTAATVPDMTTMTVPNG